MIVEITYKTSRGARSSAKIDGKKCSVREANRLVIGHVPNKIISNKDTSTAIYNLNL